MSIRFSSQTRNLTSCPTCGELFDPRTTPIMPFCSARCQQVDLGRWFNEEYGLPHESDSEVSDEDLDD